MVFSHAGYTRLSFAGRSVIGMFIVPMPITGFTVSPLCHSVFALKLVLHQSVILHIAIICSLGRYLLNCACSPTSLSMYGLSDLCQTPPVPLLVRLLPYVLTPAAESIVFAVPFLELSSDDIVRTIPCPLASEFSVPPDLDSVPVSVLLQSGVCTSEAAGEAEQ